MLKETLIVITSIGLSLSIPAQAGVVDDLLKSYEAEGASNFSADNGKAIWNKEYPAPDKSGTPTRRCATCHTEDLRNTGKHAKTGKLIEPMAPSENPERLTDLKQINKWFKRNCKWTMGRECTPQEKGDLLMFIRSQ